MTMYAYVVRGSEDGNIAVTSRKKRAFEVAYGYMKRACELYEVDPKEMIIHDLIRQNYYAEFSHELLHTTCEIEKFDIE